MKLYQKILGAIALLTVSTLAIADDDKPQAKQEKAPITDETIIAEQLPSYPLTKCAVSNEPLDEPVNHVHEGRLLRFCCGMCVKAFKEDPKTYIAELDKAVIAAQKDSYPLETCVISGEKLGSMGAPLDVVHGTRLVRLCCKGCVKAFEKDPAKHLETVNRALIAAQLKTYPLETCLISDEKLGSMGAPIDFLYGTRLVRICCKGCKKSFHKEPAKYLALIDRAAAAKSKKDHDGKHDKKPEHGEGHGEHGR